MRRISYPLFSVLPFLLIVASLRLHAQNPPCGVEILRIEGPNIDDRFVPFPPGHVKFVLLKAFPAVSGKVTKEDGYYLEGEEDINLKQAIMRKNQDEGVKGKYAGSGAMGKFSMDIHEETQGGVQGSRLHIEFHHNAMLGRLGPEGYARPLGDETLCLAKLLSANDPVAHPRGLELADAGPPRAVDLPDATPVTAVLRDPIYTRKMDADSTGKEINFEVAEDVVVDGTVLIRRGALAAGHFKDIEKTKMAGRHAVVDFVFDTVTAVDGQKIPVTGASGKTKGARKSDTWQDIGAAGTFGLFIHGVDVFIRAGTSYDLAVTGQHTVQGGR